MEYISTLDQSNCSTDTEKLKKLKMFFLIISTAIFTIIYLSFFPGRFSNDSYNAYIMALGKYHFSDVSSPYFVLTWKIIGNYNFGPFVFNLVLIYASLYLIYQKLKSTIIPQLILLTFFLIPPFLISFTYAWKDNVLLSSLLLLVALLIHDNSKKLSFFIVIIFTWIFGLRFNAFFAGLPLLWFYCSKFNYRTLRKKLAYL